MRKAYRILALALVFLLLSGCASNSGSGGQIIGGNTGPADAPESTANVQYIPEKVKDSKNLPVLKLVCVLDGRSVGGKNERKTCQENAINAVNQYLKENDAGFRIQIVIITGVEHDYGMGIDCFDNSRVREAAAEADLLYADFFPERMTEYLEPITEYISGSDAPLSGAVPHDSAWFRTSLNGEVYGIPHHNTSPYGQGWLVEAEVLERCGLTPEDFQREYWQMDDVFARIHEVYGTEFMMVNGDNPSLAYIDNRAAAIPSNILYDFSDFLTFVVACYGIDSSGDRPEIVNILDTDYIKQLHPASQRYSAAGYTFLSTSLEQKPQLVTYTDIHTDTPMLRDGQWYIPVTQKWNRYTMYGKMLGIAKTSQRKAEAVSFLQLLAEDVQLRDLLSFGQEGVNYTLEDGIGIPDKENRHDLSFLTPMADFGSFDTRYWRSGLNKFAVEEGEDPLEVYRQIVDSSQTLCPLDYRYWFDFSPIAEDIQAVISAVQLNVGCYSELTPEEYEAWMQEIREAGGDKVQAELQRQLDAWLAENPGWE